MITIQPEQTQIRFRRIPVKLQDLIFDEKEADVVDLIGQELGFDLQKKQKLADLVLWVFLGFLSLDEVGKELAETLSLEPAVAEKVAGKLYDRVFAFAKSEITANYKPIFTPDEEKTPGEEGGSEETRGVFQSTAVGSTDNNEIFSLESLAAATSDLSSTIHPDAITPSKPSTPSITQSSTTPTPQSSPFPLPQQPSSPVSSGATTNPQSPDASFSPVILHSESELAPISFEVNLKDIKNTQKNNHSFEAGEVNQAKVQLGTKYLTQQPTPQQTPQQTPPTNNTSPSPIEISSKNLTEFTPVPITKPLVVSETEPAPSKAGDTLSSTVPIPQPLASPITPTSNNSVNLTIPVPQTPFIVDLKNISSPTNTPESKNIASSVVSEAEPLMINTAEPRVVSATKPSAAIDQTQQINPTIQQLTPTQQSNNQTASTGILGRFSNMFSGLKTLGEKPAPVENRSFGPPPSKTNADNNQNSANPPTAKVVDYTKANQANQPPTT